MAYGWPCDPNTRITQYFGHNPASYQPDGHTGIDFALGVGSPVFAIGKGVVRWSSWAKGLGWPNQYYINPDFTPNDGIDQSAGIVVIIDHGPIVSIYGHLNETPLNNGDTVQPGQLIGRSGNTGFSSGPHLHFEILPDKWNVHGRFYGRVNPLDYITKVIAKPAAPSLEASPRVGGWRGAKYRPTTTRWWPR
jgi:murein DD-endopeptidase MepM/ murein hydrolase activator NlpD